MRECGEIWVTYTAKGLARYNVEIQHPGLHKYRRITRDDRHVVEQEVLVAMAQWDEMWAKRLEREQRVEEIADNRALAAERTKQAEEALGAVKGVLEHTLHIDDAVDWEALKNYSDFPEPQPKKPEPPNIPPEPQRSDPGFAVTLGLLDGVFQSRRVKKEQEAQARFRLAQKRWQEAKKSAIAYYNEQVRTYNSALRAWKRKRVDYLKKRDEGNSIIDAKKAKYLTGDPEAVFDYCDMVLSNSQYPDYFPESYQIDYNPENRLLVADYQLPSPDSIPRLKQVNYVQSRDEFVEKYVSESELNRLYDDLLYQIALRTVHEIYEADQIGAVESVVFNGYVRSTDPATGHETNACVLSLQASKDEFLQVDLANVEAKACFKKLKGVGSSKLHSMTPVPPLVIIERSDERFVASYAVADGLEEGENLAVMDWEDFEHLVRELFESEFTPAGGEVKVTRASRDGGVDAVVFDPDPIHGGKIVIQAKRYSRTVGVSAVRDLYGTVMNEGANKGILVTTSDYGPDAYGFAKGKPLVLLSGSNLLHLLQKHGHKARIDLQEARKLLAERENGVNP